MFSTDLGNSCDRITTTNERDKNAGGRTGGSAGLPMQDAAYIASLPLADDQLKRVAEGNQPALTT